MPNSTKKKKILGENMEERLEITSFVLYPKTYNTTSTVPNFLRRNVSLTF